MSGDGDCLIIRVGLESVFRAAQPNKLSLQEEARGTLEDAEMTIHAPSLRWSTLIFLLVWLMCGVYTGINVNKGWDPSDEGTLGQSAERVLNGEIPHKDFDDPYTGGLAYIDAFLFRLFGINLIWLRIFLFACFLVWVPAVYALAREFLSPWVAAGVTMVAVAWSVPNYAAALPSWFNLFFATFGTLALAKYLRKPATSWLVLAGLCGGISFLIKSVALYYIAAALLFFVYREQGRSRNESAPRRYTPAYSAFVVACLAVFIIALIKLVFNVGEAPEYLHFVFPGTAIACLLATRERVAPTVSTWTRFQTLLQMAVPFLVAAAFPVCLFFIYYWSRDALPALINGLFVSPFRRLSVTHLAPNGLLLEYPSVLAALFLLEAAKLRGQPRKVLSICLAVLAVMVLITSRTNDVSFMVGLTSATGIIPVLTVAALIVLFRKRNDNEAGSVSDEQLFLLLAMTALCSLIQFPFSSPGYFFYIAPLAVLLAAFLIARLQDPPRALLYVTLAFYVLFPIFVSRLHFFGSHYYPENNTRVMLPRAGGLQVTAKSAEEYNELIPFVQNVAGDNPIVAGPDCPEIYFFSGVRNQTRVLYDSLVDPIDYKDQMRLLVERPNFVKVAVIKDSAGSAGDQLQVLRTLVAPRFPNSRKIGRFTVYWRP
jgi:Dolichyl-phosphate-mannose-protein mannosyltransferase